MDQQINGILSGTLNFMMLKTLSALGSLEESRRRGSDIMVCFLTATEENL